MEPQEDLPGDSVTREEVAPGVVMEKRRASEPDGRYLLYYKFFRQGDAEEAGDLEDASDE